MGAQVAVHRHLFSSSACTFAFLNMLDFLTLISTMGVQQELSEAKRERKENLVIRDEESGEEALVEQAADSLSSVFEGLESAMSETVDSLFGTSSAAEAMPVTPNAA